MRRRRIFWPCATNALGRNADALTALGRITEPDANVYLQRGLLCYAEKDFAQAEKDFARAWELETQSYAAGYNLLLAQLCQKKRPNGAAIIDRLLPLAPSPAEQRFLSLLRALLLNAAPVRPLGRIAANPDGHFRRR